MTDQSVFNQQESQDVQPTVEEQLASIKNEQGEQKYKTVDDAIKALSHSQEYIPTLKKEKEELEKQLEEFKQKQADEEALQKAKELLQGEEEEQAAQPQADIESQLNALLEKREQQSTLETNKELVNKTLFEGLGEKAPEIVAQKLKELGMAKETFESLAGQSPQAALQLFGNQPKQTSVTSGGQFFQPKDDNKLVIEKNLMQCKKSSDTKELLAKIREHVYKQHNVEI